MGSALNDDRFAVLFAPHADDESLFAFYTMMREDAHVHVLLDSIPSRMDEFAAAMQVAGRGWTYSTMWEKYPNWDLLGEIIADTASGYETIIAPAYEDGGHEHHNAIATMVDALEPVLDPGTRFIRYLTYVRGRGRSTHGTEVGPSSLKLVDLKLAALQCYQSQWDDPATSPWFPGGKYGTAQEWVR